MSKENDKVIEKGLDKDKVETTKVETQVGTNPTKSTKEPEVSIKDLTKMFETMKAYVDTKVKEWQEEKPKVEKEKKPEIVKPDLGETIKDEKPKEETPILSNIRNGIFT